MGAGRGPRGGIVATPVPGAARAQAAAAALALTACVHDVCVIIVSHNGKRWLDAALGTLFARAGDVDLDVVVVDNGERRRRPPTSGERFPRPARCAAEPRLRARQQSRPRDRRRPLRPLPQPRHRIPRGHPRRAGRRARPPSRDRARRGAPARQPRRPGAQHPPLPLDRQHAGRSALGRAGPGPAAPARRARARPAPPTAARPPATGPRARSCSPAARRSAATGGFDERFFLFSEETDLCWRVKGRRLGGRAPAAADDPPLRAAKLGRAPRMEAQVAYARLQFARKHFAHAAAVSLGDGAALRPARRSLLAARRAQAEPARGGARGAGDDAERPPALRRPAASCRAQATIVSAPGSTRSSTRVCSPM